MKYTMDNKQFAGKIKSIAASTSKMREDVQSALIAATYLCLKNSGGTTPFQQILDAVGTAAHRQGITEWAETFAPVILREGKLVLNKTAYKELDIELAVLDFDKFIAESGMDVVMWYEIAKEKNSVESVWNYGTAIDGLCKKLEKNGMPDLAKEMRASYNTFLARANADAIAALKAEAQQ